MKSNSRPSKSEEKKLQESAWALLRAIRERERIDTGNETKPPVVKEEIPGLIDMSEAKSWLFKNQVTKQKKPFQLFRRPKSK